MAAGLKLIFFFFFLLGQKFFHDLAFLKQWQEIVIFQATR